MFRCLFRCHISLQALRDQSFLCARLDQKAGTSSSAGHMHDSLCTCAQPGIELAAKDGIDWILHIDTDELVYPGGGAEYSIQRVLASVPADVDTLVFPNYESLPERDDVQDPFTEVRHSHKRPN